MENIFQMALILFETFHKPGTHTFLSMFNVIFGLVTCTLTFAEHAGHRFVAKHPYMFKDELDALLSRPTKGLTKVEKEWRE
jgi:hypothetical protein